MSAKALIRVVHEPQLPRGRRRGIGLGYKVGLGVAALAIAGAASGVLLTAMRDDAGHSADVDVGGSTAAEAAASAATTAAGAAGPGALPAGQRVPSKLEQGALGAASPAETPSPGAAAQDQPVASAAAPSTRAAASGAGGAAASGAKAAPAETGASDKAARPVAVAAADAGVAGAPDGGLRLAEVKVTSDREGEHDEFVRVARFAATGGASLEGKVVDADNGRPISGVVVEARLGRRLVEATTDAAGSYRMPGMLPGTHVVVWIGGVRDPFVSERIEVRVPGEGQVADTGTVKLLKGDEMGSSSRGGWVGLFVTARGGRVAASAVTPWLPADRASIVVGDVLISIDGRDVAGLGSRAVTFLLRGPVGSPVKLVAESAAGTRREVSLERVVR